MDITNSAAKATANLVPQPATDTTATPPEAVDTFADLLRRAEIQTLQLELEVRFKRNMAIFKEAAPEIYDQFNEYEPKELRLLYTPEGYLNLVNFNLNNRPVYDRDPKDFIDQQVKDFMLRPTFSSVSFGKSKIMNDAHIHVPLINNMIDVCNEMMTTTKVDAHKPVGLMMMTGCGIGYQIPQLLEKMDIYNLCIFDPHKDSFYASLHTLDWGNIIQYILRPGRMIKLFIGMESKDAMASLKLLTDKIGLHNIVYTFIYRHFSSVKEEEFVEQYRKEFHLNASGTGFFDDEQVSFSHTIANLNRGVYLYRQQPVKETTLPPLILVGNGPSLDKHIDFLQRNRANAVVFSCGMALSSLAKKGIKPDFHVEMERNIDVKDWLEVGTTAADRQGITLLCLNTSSPAVIELFDDACIAKKPNDCGERLIDDAMHCDLIKPLPLCNPTVTNAGLSFALSMGFKEVYLVGVDLGMSPEGDHHSSLSTYHELAKKTNIKNFSPLENTQTNYMIKGNFCGQVSTSLFLDSTRVNMQILLTYYERSLGDVKVYNSNNGARINGTIPIPLDDIVDFPSLTDKPAVLHNLKCTHFVIPPECQHTTKSVTKQYLPGFFAVRKKIGLPKQIGSAEELYQKLSSIYYIIRNLKDEDPIATMLLRGSLHGYFTLLLKSCLYQTDEQKFSEAYQLGRKAYMTFLKSCYEFMDKTPLKLDDTHDKNIMAARKMLGPTGL